MDGHLNGVEHTMNCWIPFNTKETTSSYLLCLEQVLQQVVKQGALTPVETDQTRLCQVQVGARYSLALRDLNLSG